MKSASRMLQSNKSLVVLLMLVWSSTSNFQLTRAIPSATTRNTSNSNIFYNMHKNYNNINSNLKNNVRIHKMFERGNYILDNSGDLNRIKRRDYYNSINPYGNVGGGGSSGGVNVGNVIYDGNLNAHNWHHNYGIGRRTAETATNHMSHGNIGFALGGIHNNKASTASSSVSSSSPAGTTDGGGSGGSAGTNGNTAGTNSASSPTAGGGEVMLPKSSFPLSAQEPTCEQLRAMWIFSRRQSRAAEMTNEIPTYRDPFAYNVWEPYYSTTRSMGAVRLLPRYMERVRLPVFGRVISQEPLLTALESQQQQRRLAAEGRSGSSSSYRFYNTGLRRPVSTQYRYIGNVNSAGGSGGGGSSNAKMLGGSGNSDDDMDGSKQQNAVVQGSFQKLKELIWTERAKDLTQQRRAEELAARAAVLKEIANGQNIQPPISTYKQHLYGKMESAIADENRAPDMDASGAYQHDARYTNSNSGRNGAGATPSGSDIIDTPTFTNPKYTQYQPKAANSNNNNKHSHLHRSYSNAKVSTGPSSGLRIGTNGKNIMFNRLLMPSAMQSPINVNGFDKSNGDSVGGGAPNDASHDYSTGTPKAYPMRGTHFRERNHLLYKQQQQQFAPNVEYFQRNVRNYEIWPMAQTLLLQEQQKQDQPSPNNILMKQQKHKPYYRHYLPESNHRKFQFYDSYNNNRRRPHQYDDTDLSHIMDYHKFVWLNDMNNNHNKKIPINAFVNDDDDSIDYQYIHDRADADVADDNSASNEIMQFGNEQDDIDYRGGNDVTVEDEGDDNIGIDNVDSNENVNLELNLPLRNIASFNDKMV